MPRLSIAVTSARVRKGRLTILPHDDLVARAVPARSRNGCQLIACEDLPHELSVAGERTCCRLRTRGNISLTNGISYARIYFRANFNFPYIDKIIVTNYYFLLRIMAKYSDVFVEHIIFIRVIRPTAMSRL